ncbi:MAG: ATP-grasp domain-containing protein [Anaerolineae bacterium]|nr:ATP-grasp domain-containing protein [Anaerolineae bacterium]NUQ02859.1 ATP-grasp domain-containing protein [Anaerolineae bacterium]
MAQPLTILFLSSSFKGEVMLQTAKALGCRVVLVTEESLRNEPWPRESIDLFQFVPDLRRYQDVTNTVSWMCRGMVIDHILPLDEFEVELVSLLREHLRLSGTGVTAARRFRDKLAMRQITDASGILVPEFIQVKNYDALRKYMERVAPPWVLKPRTEAGSMGIRKPNSSEEVWRVLDELGDRQSYYLLEQFIPGDVYHVDTLTVDGEIEFVSAQKYGAPPMQVYQGGGIFMSRIVPRESDDAPALDAINRQVLQALGMVNGVTHAEFIKAHGDGRFYFLEAAARVGGAFISDMIEQATNINLWREWAALEVAQLRGERYSLPATRSDYGGVMVTLARQQHPDLSVYNDPEVVWRANKPYHAALVVVSPDPARVESLLASYAERFARDFTTSAKPMDATRTGQTG